MTSTSTNNGSTITTSPATSPPPPIRVPPPITTPSTSVFEGEAGKTILALIALIVVILLILVGVIGLGVWMYHKMYRKAIEKQELSERSKTKTVATQTKLSGRNMEEYIRRMDTVYMSTYKGAQLPGKLDLPARWHQKDPAQFTEPWPKYYHTDQTNYITKVD
ncbi:uncharacterized protein LOC110451982 isoform X2 [Mizuhopecten yessoensis]|uniref:Uncharacterized protein n=1 Tax=Mizuhopecten yessoensis TaxID=6573 RepID=A0A210QKR0_MIZYE|nr:uncharacterized protein LOC110451982 isoform X2 [Mizuhopecten yessoensis]OWF49286.1 hypothetical protein KP79_PYT23350 [Mizuhopecten yessoensis]